MFTANVSTGNANGSITAPTMVLMGSSALVSNDKSVDTATTAAEFDEPNSNTTTASSSEFSKPNNVGNPKRDFQFQTSHFIPDDFTFETLFKKLNERGVQNITCFETVMRQDLAHRFKRRLCAFPQQPMLLFHGTANKNLFDIQKTGLLVPGRCEDNNNKCLPAALEYIYW